MDEEACEWEFSKKNISTNIFWAKVEANAGRWSRILSWKVDLVFQWPAVAFAGGELFPKREKLGGGHTTQVLFQRTAQGQGHLSSVPGDHEIKDTGALYFASCVTNN